MKEGHKKMMKACFALKTPLKAKNTGYDYSKVKENVPSEAIKCSFFQYWILILAIFRISVR